MVKKISIKKVKNRIYIIILSTLIFSIITSSIGCNIKQQLFKIPEKIKEVVKIRSDINISPINDVIGSIEEEYLYDIKREELITSAFEGIIKSTDEKYPGLLSTQDKDELEKIKDKYPEDSLDSIVEIIRKLIEKKDELKSDDLIMYANESIVKSLQIKDKYAYFFYPENYKIMMEDYSGHISGVGMYVNQIDEKIVVVKPIENTPAYRAGIKADDVIISVDGQSIESKNIDEVIALIRGKAGTKVTIIFFRPETNKKFTKELIREEIEIPNLIIEILNNKIGYVRYIRFIEGGANRLKNELEKLSDQGIEALILDLRGNTGGLLSDAVNLGQLFINRGNIVVVKEKADTIIYRGKDTPYAQFPLVIIVDKYSASASEILAGALQDHNRAKLVGNTTFGKGTVQQIFSLPDSSGIKFTTANYFLPTDRSIEEIGITPDIIINDDDKTEEDEQLEAAKKIALEIIEENKTSQINKDGK
ncbi:MAG: S41 family peptidase [Actinomycetota bacterium]